MNRIVSVSSVPNMSALAWELVESFPKGAQFFCLAQDFAEELREELAPFTNKPIYILPAHDIDTQTQRRPAIYERKERLRFINALNEEQEAYYIWTSTPLLERSLPLIFNSWKKIEIPLNKEYKRESFLEDLREHGYEEAEIVEIPGQFASRGSIVDFYSFIEEAPYRIDFNEDKVDSIFLFDPQTQIREQRLESFHLSPARELGKLKAKELKAKLKSYLVQHEYPLDMRDSALSLLSDDHIPNGFELWSFLLAENTSLSAFLKDKTHILPAALIEPHSFFQKWRLLEQQIEKKLSLASSVEDLAPKPKDYLQNSDTTLEGWSYLKTLSFFSFHKEQLNAEHNNTTPSLCRSVDVSALKSDWKGHNLKEFAERLLAESKASSLVFVFQSLSQLERLEFLLSPYGLSFDKKTSSINYEIGFHCFVGSIGHSFKVPSRNLSVITESDVLGSPKSKARKKPSKGAKEIFFRDIREGDLVVHATHGVGQYLGLKNLSIQGNSTDLIELLYKDGKVYVPVQQLRLLHRFGGEELSDASLDKLGGTTWKNKKEKVKKEILAFAGELITLYAQRTLATGLIIDTSEEKIQEFAASFPHDETPDQDKAIKAIIEDLKSGQPMDRLLCGDVGYGKTEVALRAAHAVASAGYQVAVLSPTTLLTAQHERLFKTRLGEFGLKVAGLSRFNTDKEASRILGQLKTGDLNVVVGTHRLLSADVSFKNLGLIVVDEEQRFGVLHKEKLKKLRTNVHVLSMTATPIPRTLSMAMAGIRQFSVMTTPPQDRLSVKTHVVRKNPQVIKEAIEFELKRNGQVFYLFNRVKGIEKTFEDLAKLLPGTRIDFAHGQLDEEKLEEKMLKFYRGETQVLVTTTIIEAGLDVSNANTLIVENAGNFGLSQLYQIRGRVGRSDRRAYAYLLLPESGKVTAVAEERLGILELYQDLGSGFTIASHDLDLRGAGEILGDAQSGHMTLVGSETYFELLEEGIAELKGEALDRDFEPEIQLTVNSSIPETYMKEASNRLSFYRRFSSAANEDAVEEIKAEMIDRFGPLPPSIRTLVRVMKIICVLRRLRIRSLSTGKTGTTVILDPSSTLPREKLVELVVKYPLHFQMLPEGKLLIKNPAKDTPSEEELLRRVDSTLGQLESLSGT
ncbi:MAG: transcription-repair coupling factor [Bdellovibrionota bacterium]